MAGGKGSRMDSNTEKLLLMHKKPIVMHVIDALRDSKCFEKVIAITSPNSPKAREFLEISEIDTIQTKGKSYVQDLNQILESLNDEVFVTSGDLPYLDADIIQEIVARYNPNKTWTSFLETEGFLESLGLEAEFSVEFEKTKCYYSGISLINAKKINSLDTIKENFEILDDKRVAFNLNTKQEYNMLLDSGDH